ncbi:MAG: hypothetical protein Ta2G_00220 [Termitinemataceae bacterium]|nr:MAG: hypothetical protein Ta2G_00220 [Termitinemataceae bacterium]
MEKFPFYRWWKAHEIEKIWPETLLKANERYCVTACSKFINMNFIKDHAWVLSCGGDAAAAMLLHSQRTLFPVFNGISEVHTPSFLLRALGNIELYAIQGLREDTEIVEKMLLPIGYKVREYRDFHLMMYDTMSVKKPVQHKVPSKYNLVFRKAVPEDEEKIMSLQELYEKEEVKLAGEEFNKRACRYNLSRILKKENIMLSIIDGHIVGKINTNAASFSCVQIGGVFVHPKFRNHGIASAMTEAFVKTLQGKGNKITLYVRKSNLSAYSCYKKCGFRKIADYRTVYIHKKR